MSGCTVTVGPRGEKCGATAVASSTGSGGERFFECEAHVAPSSTPAPVAAKRPALIMPGTGSKLRTERSTRYVLAAEYVAGKPHVLKGSASLEVLRKERSKRAHSSIFDTVTGEVVR